ncbi:unnamed protein product [Lymnaea stagnalis]|uniref:Cytochrome P450 n=1 Tax=Lymnaea stagnalis TaxID=6523 RepID=A0AAV2H5H7_LYMST
MALSDHLISPVVSLLTCSTAATLLLAAAAVTAAVAWYLFYRPSSQEPCDDDWSRLGVRFPKLPITFFGGSNFRLKISQLLEQYGDTVGLRLGGRLWLLTVNLDLLRTIMVKDFNNFVDRADTLNSNTPIARSLFFATGNHWRRQRQIVSPTFSSGKLKYISKTVELSAKKLADYLVQRAKDGAVVPIKDTSARYSCEVIARIAFGLEANFIQEEASEFFEHGKNMLMLSYEGISRFILMSMHRVPNLVDTCNRLFKSVQLFDAVNLTSNTYFKTVLTSTIAERKMQQRSGKERKHVDFLDLLLKANEAVRAGNPEKDEEGNASLAGTEGVATKDLDDEEMLGHSMLVIFAGLETTATTLQMCLFELARYPEIQDKVYTEIQNVLPEGEASPEDINNLHYTEWVINETLRLHPPIPTVSRKAKETRTYDGITIPKGACVMIPFWHIVMDPKIWPEPEKFIPERFSPEEKDRRDPMAFICFGQGPRLCLGMCLAYLELKQALVHILRKVKVVLNENTEPKKGAGGVEVKSSGLLTPVKPVLLAFELRQDNTQTPNSSDDTN